MTDEKYEAVVSCILQNQEKLYRLAYSYVHTKDDALDVVQNAVCKALEKYTMLRSISAVKTWLYRIVVNESITLVNKNKVVTYTDEIENLVEKNQPIDKSEETLDEKELAEHINTLPMDTQNIIKLHFYEDFTLNEVAEILEMNLNSVKTKLYRALKKLRVSIEEVSEYERN